MDLNIAKEVAALERLTVKQLRQKYVEVFGEETNGHNKVWLVRRIAWRLQVLAEGDLSERARRRALDLACDADLRMSPPRVRTPAAGRSPAGCGDWRTVGVGTLPWVRPRCLRLRSGGARDEPTKAARPLRMRLSIH